MENHLLRNTQHTELLAEIQKTVFEHGQYVDCSLLCNGSEFRVHKSILANASTFFHHIFVDHPSTDNLTVQLSPEFDVNTIFKLIEFIYIGQTHMPSHLVPTFQEACEILQIKNMTPSHLTGNDQAVIVVEIPNPGMQPDVKTGDDGIIAETQEYQDEHIVEVPIHEPPQEEGVNQYYEEQPHDPDDGGQTQHSVIMMQDNHEMNLQYIELDTHSENLIQDSIVQEDEEVEEEEAIRVQNEETAPKVQRLTAPGVRTEPQPSKEAFAKAFKALLHGKMKLNEAAEHYNVPRPILYIRYKKFLQDNPHKQTLTLAKNNAQQALEKGASVKNVFAKYNLPLKDIIKMKNRATEQQNTIPLQRERPAPSNVQVVKVEAANPNVQGDMSSLAKLHLKANEYKGRLQRAINSCKIGMGLEEASALFSIPVPTLYRNIKHMKLAHIQHP